MSFALLKSLNALPEADSTIKVQALARRESDLIQLEYQISDPNKEILDSLRDGRAPGAREDGLWRTTCMEFFWGEQDSPAYWELNISPLTRAWNIYAFSAERSPQPPQATQDFAIENLVVEGDKLRCQLRAKIDLGAIEGSLCVVIRKSERTLYFAENHAKDKPDFHARQSFRPLGV